MSLSFMNLAWEFAWAGCFLALPLPWLARRLLPAVRSGAVVRLPSLPRSGAAMTIFTTVARLPWLALLAWLLLVTAAARPRVADAPAVPYAAGRSMMLAVDVSASMATKDLMQAGRPVDRLGAARYLVDSLLADRRGDRVGLIVFGARAYLHTPPTADLEALREGLTGLEAGLVGQRTALGDAIALAVRHLEKAPAEKTLILLTDGANTAGALDPRRSAWLARRAGLRVHAVGIGNGQPAKQGGLDEATLRAIAEETGGSFTRATDAEELSALFARIDRLGAADAPDARPMRELYVWPLTGAAVLLVWLGWRRWRESPLRPDGGWLAARNQGLFPHPQPLPRRGRGASSAPQGRFLGRAE